MIVRDSNPAAVPRMIQQSDTTIRCSIPPPLICIYKYDMRASRLVCIQTSREVTDLPRTLPIRTHVEHEEQTRQRSTEIAREASQMMCFSVFSFVFTYTLCISNGPCVYKIAMCTVSYLKCNIIQDLHI